MFITEVTRRNIFDALTVEHIDWAGRLEEPDFLGRIFDLRELPSHDGRFTNASGDIWQHRVNNQDWEDDWVFTDSRFNLKSCDDAIFLRFLTETIHPVVRSDAAEVERLRQMYNSYLKEDGYELVEHSKLSGNPVFSTRQIRMGGHPSLKKLLDPKVDDDYIAQQITRMELAVDSDPDLAIGTAKELVETVCKTILQERGVGFNKNDKVPSLVKATSKLLNLTPADISDEAKAVDTIRLLLSNLATIAQRLAELRNSYGTGHGREASMKGLGPRHARLAVGASSTLTAFLYETHKERGVE